MAQSKKASQPAASSSQDNLRQLVGPVPILKDEDATAYEALRARFFVDVSPADIIEEVWVNNCADLLWEVLRLRRLKVKFLASSAHRGTSKILYALEPSLHVDDIASAWLRREPSKLAHVKHLLEQAGLDEEAITAQTFIVHLDELEKLERIIAGMEARFNKCLSEISRRRDILARRMREVSQEITDAEFSQLSPQKLAAAE